MTTAWDLQYQDPKRYRTWPSEEVIRYLTAHHSDMNAPRRALDLGCGAGGNLWALLAWGFDAYGVDPSPVARAAAMRIVEARIGSGAPVYYGTAQQIPYPDGFFDLVVDAMTLQHILPGDGRVAALQECRRVLRQGGGLVSIHLVEGTDYERLFPGVPAAHLGSITELTREWLEAGFDTGHMVRVERAGVLGQGRGTAVYAISHLLRA